MASVSTWERIERQKVRLPNRRFLLAGTANGLMDDLPVNLLDRPRAGTIMDMLTRHHILDPEAHRGEVEPARADPTGRGGDLPARRP